VNYALLDRLIDPGNCFCELAFGLGGIARLERRAELAQSGAEAGSVGTVLRGAFRGLAGALQRRKKGDIFNEVR